MGTHGGGQQGGPPPGGGGGGGGTATDSNGKINATATIIKRVYKNLLVKNFILLIYKRTKNAYFSSAKVLLYFNNSNKNMYKICHSSKML